MEKKLKLVAFFGIYYTFVLLIGIMVINSYRTCTKINNDFQETQQININTFKIYNDKNIIDVDTKPTIIEEPINRENYVYQIANIRWGLGDKNFTIQHAHELLNKIEFYAKNNDLTLQSALTIVNVESDFNKNAYVKSTQAYGLTQSTPVCLNEYNWMNGTDYTVDDLFDVDINLEVGFWYYNRILTHYNDCYGYITTSTPENALRDAYLAYNVGVTMFDKIGQSGRNELRNGVYPCNMYGSQKGEAYEPINRYLKLAMDWS